jgi:uncharacterized tellurite resistance protein B-like protein
MLDRIRRFFDQNLGQLSSGSATAGDGTREHAYRLATAALLVEVSRADFEVCEIEQASVENAIRRAFDLSLAETRELVELAEAEAAEATSLYQFTRLVNDSFDLETKEHIVELLWQVAHADGSVDKHEEHLVRRIADLIHVPHRAFIRAKHRAASSSPEG